MGKMETDKTSVWLKAEDCKQGINAVFVQERTHETKAGEKMPIMVFRSDIAEETILPKAWRNVSYADSIKAYGDDNDLWIEKPFRIISDTRGNIKVLASETRL